MAFALCEMSDEEFVPFLHSLGVETYKKSFEWMLSDRDFAGILCWLSDNLDSNNALSAREECRFKELEKKGVLLSPEDLESSITNIQEKYEGICLPGDKEALEDMKLNISLMKERLTMLKTQLVEYENLKRQNELISEQLNLDIIKLNSAHRQYVEDETKASDECMVLAHEVETHTQDVIGVIADKLAVYTNCHLDKETARKFFTFGPFESYRQSQSLFRSQFDLYTSKKFSKVPNVISEEELSLTLAEACDIEKRLSDAAWTYIESKAELCGERAKLNLVTNYMDVYPSQISAYALEAQSPIELLEQEESILFQQLHTAVRQLIDARTKMVEETAASCALAVRQQIYTDITHVLDTCSAALCLDRVLYTALRQELSTCEQFVQFAMQLKEYVEAEGEAVCVRIKSMNKINSEHSACESKVNFSDTLLQALYVILGSQPDNTVHTLVKLYNDLLSNLKELAENVDECYKRNEKCLIDFKSLTKPVREYIWNSCTRQVNSCDTGVCALQHTLRQRIDTVDKNVLEATTKFTTCKNGDKHHLRKLWQWFLGNDPTKFLSALKNTRNRI